MSDHFDKIDFGRLQTGDELGELFRQQAEIIPFFTKVDNGFACLSQWHTSYFTVDGVDYCTAEQYMMHAKARLFGDTEMTERIVKATAPHDHKRLGQNVRGFDSQTWVRERCRIAYTGNLAKFSQARGCESAFCEPKERSSQKPIPRIRSGVSEWPMTILTYRIRPGGAG